MSNDNFCFSVRIASSSVFRVNSSVISKDGRIPELPEKRPSVIRNLLHGLDTQRSCPYGQVEPSRSLTPKIVKIMIC